MTVSGSTRPRWSRSSPIKAIIAALSVGEVESERRSCRVRGPTSEVRRTSAQRRRRKDERQVGPADLVEARA